MRQALNHPRWLFSDFGYLSLGKERKAKPSPGTVLVHVLSFQSDARLLDVYPSKGIVICLMWLPPDIWKNHFILATTEGFKCFHWDRLVEIGYSIIILFFTPLMNETKFSSQVFN